MESFLDFRPSSAGSYYIGVSSHANGGYNPLRLGSASGGEGTGSYTLELSPLERSPIAIADSFITGEGGAVTLAVLANDSDPDGDPFALAAINGTPVAAGDTIDLASGARLTVNADGALGYDPDGAFDRLRTGEQAADSFTYTIEEVHGLQATAQVTVTVQGADNVPTVVDDAASTTERAPATIAVLTNDAGALPDRPLQVTAINGDAIAVGGTVTLASGATLLLNADQTLAYDPNGKFAALGVGERQVESFTYAVADGAGNGGAASVAVTVTGLNDSPLALNDRFATDEETVITLKLLANDRDVDGDPLELREINGQRIPSSGVVTLPSGATLRVGDDGAVAFDPRAAFDRLPGGAVANDSFTYEIRDGQGGTDAALATIRVAGFADPDFLVPQKPFDPLEYTASYPDLIQAFGTDAAAATAHYATTGFAEGREISFDGLEYVASYGDLVKAFGANRDAGSGHFITNGFDEGRSTTFNAFEYIASYNDLADTYGVDQTAGSTHFLTYGIAEERQVSFDGLEYVAGYDDLIDAFGADEDAGAAHFIASGSGEGRTVRFDGLEYIASHADLIRAFGPDRDAGSRHYIDFGDGEDRARDDFDAEQYLANYADLQAAFGDDTDAATRHYITNGFFEGRTDEASTAAALDFLS